MSYDVAAGNREENYTSNMRRFFTDFGAYPGDWAARDRKEVGREIGQALRRIAREDWDRLHAEYDAPDGWGDVESATRFLIRVWAGCFYEVPETVEVWW